MHYLIAFLVAGVVGVVGELLYFLFKKKMPAALVVLFGIGSLLMAFGVSDAIAVAAPGCLAGMLMNGGAMFAQSLLLIVRGDWSLFVVIWVIILFMAAIGILAGATRMLLEHRKSNEESMDGMM